MIDEDCLDRLVEEVNDKLQESGQVTTSELCKICDLPGSFLTQALTQWLGRIINGPIDLNNRAVIFTEAFVAWHKAHIHGLFSAFTRLQQWILWFQNMDVKRSCSTLCLRNLLIVDVYEAVWLARDRTRRYFVPDIYSRQRVLGWSPFAGRVAIKNLMLCSNLDSQVLWAT